MLDTKCQASKRLCQVRTQRCYNFFKMVFMRTKLNLSLLCLIGVLAACQPAAPTIEAAVNNEFVLARDQSARIKGTDLTITFNSVLSDDRCPIEIECAASGPVTVSLSVHREGEDIPTGMTLQVFTGEDGRTSGAPPEAVQNSAETAEHVIWLIGVLPYPKNLSGIKASDYEATLVVTAK